MEEPLIRDIPGIKKNLELVKGMKSLNGKVLQLDHTFRLINENTQGNPVTRGKPNSSWTIYTWGIP